MRAFDRKRLMELVAIDGRPVTEQCRLMGMSHGMLWSYETGRHEPSARMLAAMADFYGVTADWLLGVGER